MADPSALIKLSETDVNQEIPREQYGPVMMSPPFVYLDGSFNTRDLGLIPNSPLRPGYAYRSGVLSGLTDNGKGALASKNGIQRVFDLRSPEERTEHPDPEIPNVDNVWVESTGPDSVVDLNDFVSGGGEEGYKKMYLEVLDLYSPSWKAVLEHVRDKPTEPFLIHCTAGRDRTGVLAGMLLTLAGASPEVVTMDYLLSRIGNEPVRKMLIHFAMAGTGAKSENDPGFYNLCSLRASSWNAFIEGVQKQYGGFEQFIVDKLGFSKDDVAKIKSNLTS